VVPIIILEGPDGSGKTTLLHKLAEEFHLPIASRVVSKAGEAEIDLAGWVDETNEAGFQFKLYDRHRLISNSIYSPILGRASQDAFRNRDWVIFATHNFYEQVDPCVIYCLPPLEVVRANVQADSTNHWLLGRIDAVYEAYLARAALEQALRPARTAIYDYTTDGQEDNPVATFKPWLVGWLIITKELT